MYWYISPAADAAISAAIAADPRRKWDPRSNTPSLADLKGSARQYAAKYARSRGRLLTKAGVKVTTCTCGERRRLVYLVTLPGEPLTATGAPATLTQQ
jgi:hypothetical protein